MIVIASNPPTALMALFLTVVLDAGYFLLFVLALGMHKFGSPKKALSVLRFLSSTGGAFLGIVFLVNLLLAQSSFWPFALGSVLASALLVVMVVGTARRLHSPAVPGETVVRNRRTESPEDW